MAAHVGAGTPPDILQLITHILDSAAHDSSNPLIAVFTVGGWCLVLSKQGCTPTITHVCVHECDPLSECAQLTTRNSPVPLVDVFAVVSGRCVEGGHSVLPYPDAWNRLPIPHPSSALLL